MEREDGKCEGVLVLGLGGSVEVESENRERESGTSGDHFNHHYWVLVILHRGNVN